jgi:hypothetical protein
MKLKPSIGSDRIAGEGDQGMKQYPTWAQRKFQLVSLFIFCCAALTIEVPILIIMHPHFNRHLPFYQQISTIIFLIILSIFWKTLRDSLTMTFSATDTTSENFQKRIAQKIFQLALLGNTGIILAYLLGSVVMRF